MEKINRIFIVGEAGAGKGVLAQAIAKKLGWKFINADIFSCTTLLGRTLSDVIGKEGERRLNQTLVEVLKQNITEEKCVVTTDEYIVADEQARVLLQGEFTVYATASSSVLVERLSGYRPLLPVDNYASWVDAQKKKREQYFRDIAKLTLNTDDGEIDKHVEFVLNKLNE